MSATDNSEIMASQLSNNKANPTRSDWRRSKSSSKCTNTTPKTLLIILYLPIQIHMLHKMKIFLQILFISIFLVGLIIVVTLMIYLGGPSVNPETGEKEKMNIVWKLLFRAVIAVLIMANPLYVILLFQY